MQTSNKIQGSIVALLLLAGEAAAQPVFVSGDEDGQGFLRQRSNDCYLVTLQHVLGQAREATLVGDRAERHQAMLERSYEPDLAILRVPSLSGCPTRFPDGGALDRLLQAGSEARLVSRSSSGAVRQTPIEIIASDERFIRIRTQNGERLFRGMSGSPLMIGGSTAGMLQSVDADSGTGTVLRQDYMSRVLESWFLQQQTAKPSILTANPTLAPTTASNDLDGLISESDQKPRQNSRLLPSHLAPLDPLPKKSGNSKEDNRD